MGKYRLPDSQFELVHQVWDEERIYVGSECMEAGRERALPRQVREVREVRELVDRRVCQFVRSYVRLSSLFKRFIFRIERVCVPIK